MKKVAVILSGCGVFDGAEIYESTITLLSLDRHNMAYQCMAPNVSQMHVINHLTGEVSDGESRNVLVESARIARGEIIDIAEAQIEDYVAVIFPGGFGAAKNLCDFAIKGPDCTVNPDVEQFILSAFKHKLPMGFVCIAPAIMGKVAQKAGLTTQLTLGEGEDWANKMNAMAQTHIACPVQDIVIDEDHKIISTPAYQEAKRISEAADGIEKLVEKLVSWIV